MSEIILALDSIGKKVFIVLANTSLQAVLLILLVWFIIRVFRLSSATTRYYLWFMAVFGILTLPLFSELLPGINFQIMRTGEATTSPMQRENHDGIASPVFNPANIETETATASEEASSRTHKRDGFDMERRRGLEMNLLPFRATLNLANTASLVWFLVTFLMFYRLIKSYRWLKRLLRKSLKVEEGPIFNIISMLKERLDISRKIDLFISKEIHSPTSFGLFSTNIVLPESLVNSSNDELEMVLSHEMAHAKRNDFLVNLLQRLLQSIFFFHPLFQMASRQLTREREHICDDWVIQATGKRDDYAGFLIKLVENAIFHPKSISMAMMGHPYNISRRIDMIIDDRRGIITGISRKAGVAILLIGFILLPALAATRVVYTDELRVPLFAPVQLDIPEEPAARLGKGTIYQITYSPDGKLIAIAGGLGIWLYNAVDLTEVGLLKGHNSPVYAVSFSPDGKLLASGGGWLDNTVRLWDVEAQKEVVVLRGHTEYVCSVAFSPDGKFVASGSADKTIRLWDVEAQKEVAVLIGHDGYAYSVAFSPDGKLLASGGVWDNTVRLWNVETKAEVAVLRGHDFVETVAFSPDGKLLASGGWNDKTVRIWDVERKENIAVLKGHTGGVVSVSFSPDGKLLASVGDNTVRLWDVEKMEEVAVLKHTGKAASVSFSPDGKLLASIIGSIISFWDVVERKEVAMLHEHTGRVYSVLFSPDGKLLASGSYDEQAVRLWDVKKREEIAVLKHTEEVSPVSFSPDGKLLASGGEWPNGTIKVWALPERNEVAVLTGHADKVESLSFSPDGKLLASGSYDMTVRFWDVAKQKEVAVLKHAGVVASVSFSPDGELLASGGFWPDNTVRLWDVAKQKEVALIGHTGGMYSVAFSPNGKWLASGSGDKTVRLWDVEGQKEVAVLRGHTGVVLSVAFSPDGKWLASGSNDGTVRLWDVEGQKEVAVLKEHTGGAFSVVFSPSGKWLASGNNDGTVLLWEVNIEVPGWRMEPAEKQLVTWGRVKRTALYQNYPNPFNPETWIPFRLAKASNVSISIYAQSGQLVRTLRLGYKEEGYYLNKDKAAYWDGRNFNGEEVANGVYFYTMEAGKFRATRKMAIAR